MKLIRYAAVFYFLLFLYVVCGIRVFPIFKWSDFEIVHGYNLDIWKRYSDLKSLHKSALLLKNVDFWGNILLFIPLPFCIQVFFTKKIGGWKLLIVGISISVAIEICQYIFDFGFADINDVITNSLGAAIGLWLSKIIMKQLKDKSRTTIQAE